MHSKDIERIKNMTKDELTDFLIDLEDNRGVIVEQFGKDHQSVDNILDIIDYVMGELLKRHSNFEQVKKFEYEGELTYNKLMSLGDGSAG